MRSDAEYMLLVGSQQRIFDKEITTSCTIMDLLDAFFDILRFSWDFWSDLINKMYMTKMETHDTNWSRTTSCDGCLPAFSLPDLHSLPAAPSHIRFRMCWCMLWTESQSNNALHPFHNLAPLRDIRRKLCLIVGPKHLILSRLFLCCYYSSTLRFVCKRCM